MIKINLLPIRDAKRAVRTVDTEATKDILLKLVLPIGITFLLLIAVFAYMEITKSGINKDIEKNKMTLTQLQKKIEEVNKFEQMNRDIEKKNKIIEELRKMQYVPIMLLNTVAKKLPDGVWLTKLTYENKEITIEGMAYSNLNIVAFVDNLKSVNDFQEVNLVESQQTEYEKVSIYRFLIKFNLRG